MPQPGTIFSSMPPRPTDQARRMQELEATVRMQGSAPAGQAMQVGAGGILINDGGSLTIQSPGSLNVAGGALNSGGSITAVDGITAGTTLSAGGGKFGVDASGNVTGASLTVGAGTVTAGNVTSSGQVESNGAPFKSLPSYNHTVNIGPWKVAYLDSDGTLGVSSSSDKVKTALTPMTAADVERFLTLTPYWGRYVWDDPTVPPRVFLLAADVQAAGFGPDVAPAEPHAINLTMPDGTPVIGADGAPCVIPAGEASSVNYGQLVVPLLAAVKTQAAQIAQLAAAVKITFTGAAA